MVPSSYFCHSSFSDQNALFTLAETRGQRSVFALVDPRHPQSTATVKDKDQFILRDYSGSFIAVRRTGVFGGVARIEDATLFQLELYGSIILRLPSLISNGSASFTAAST